ncbi:MAG: aspartate--tRNA(Asn) ligase [Candidatus Aenigmarchaeota archaeon]|nr:aspartate--tRNA(Asn) ligase [Candidatus Aenigmarchaeota archaeon]
MIKRTHYTNELKKAIGKDIKIVGWVHDSRVLGGINFLLLRDNKGIVQITAPKAKVSSDVLKICQKLHQEDVIAVKGKVVKSKIAKTGIEIIPSKIEVISQAHVPLPLDPRGVTKANLDTRLEWRVLDLRVPENLAIFKIQAKIAEWFEEYLRKEGYLQVFTPCLIGGISEGGADVFPVVYFEKQAFLRQDPQLHRELLILAGFDKIFDLGPSWRAELSHTPRHLCEHRGCAVELAFIKDETDTMRVEEELIIYALKKVKKECEEELKLLGKEIKIPRTPFPELRFPKIYEVLEKEFDKKIPYGEDYDRESEKLLGEYVKRKYKSDFFFVNRFPFKAKPFYVMRVDEDPRWARSVDLIFKGVEQSSGGQREHRYEKIIQQLKEKQMNVESMRWFTEHFKYGTISMGGFNLGIERFTMQLLDVSNIREAVLFPRTPERMLP